MSVVLLAVALLPSCVQSSVTVTARNGDVLLVGLDLNDNRAFGMSFTTDGQLVVSGTAHNKRPAIARWDGSKWNKLDVSEQMWLEKLPSGELIGIGTTKLFTLGTDATSVKEIGVITPNPRTALNQSSARAAGDGSIFFTFETGRFHRIPPGTTTAVTIDVPPGTNPDTALPGAYARTGDGRMFAGVRGAGIYEVTAASAEMIVPCSDPEINDCNGGDILVVDSYGKEPLFRSGTIGGKVYRLDLTVRRLVLVADIATMPGRILQSVADAPNGDVLIMVSKSSIATDGGDLFRVPAGGGTMENIADDIFLNPAALVVRNDGRAFLNSGFAIEEVR